MHTNHTLNFTTSNLTNFTSTRATPGSNTPGNVFSHIGTVKIVVYSSIIIIAFFGNGLLVLTIACTEKLRSTTNYFLLNMAIADLLVAVLCAPYQLASWKFPQIKIFDNRICKSMPFIQLSTIGISIYTMFVIGVDRYRAVTNPLKSRLRRQSYIIAMMIVWLAAFLTSAPTLFVYEIKTFQSPQGNYTLCGEYGWKNPKRDAAAYTYALFTLQYAVPCICVAALYLGIFLNLWYHNFPGMQNMSKANLQLFRRKHYRRKRTFIMLLAVYLAFVFCNLPMHVVSLIFYVQGSSFKAPPYMGIVVVCAEMAMYMNSALNPILYGFLHKKFSACSKALLMKAFCGEKRRNYDTFKLQLRVPRKKLSSGTNLSPLSSVKVIDRSIRIGDTKV